MDPHEREYAAAASCIHDQTPSLRPEPAVGDYVSGYTAGRRWAGRVESIEAGRACIDVGGATLSVPVSDITH